MTIKKAYVELVEFLEENKGKKVATILEEVKLMTQQKANTRTFLTDEKGTVVAIFCYYHKQWEMLGSVEYGKKASSSTGFNTMCKIGASKWTKQNNAVKKVGIEVLHMLETGAIEASEIADTKERLTATAKELDETDKPEGFATLEELQA